MRGLIVIAHGSRREQSNEHILSMVDQLTSMVSEKALPYDQVKGCFLELAEPAFDAQVAKCVTDGATQIDVLPMFLAPGNHIMSDIPELIETAQSNHPNCEFQQLSYMGESQQILAKSLLNVLLNDEKSQ